MAALTAGTFDLLRHGEPIGGKRYRGQLDDPLSETGWEQMWDAVGDAAPWDRIVTSPLSRCAAFAEALAQRHGLAVEYEDRLKEIGFGDWEGKTAAELEHEDPQQLPRFYADPVSVRPAGAEPVADFIARIRAGWEDCLSRYSNERVLIVAHAGTIRAIIGEVLQVPPAAIHRIKVPYAGLSRIEVSDQRPPSLVFHHGRL